MSQLSKVLGEGGLVVTSLFGFKFSKGRADRVTRTMDRGGSGGKQSLLESRAFGKNRLCPHSEELKSIGP